MRSTAVALLVGSVLTGCGKKEAEPMGRENVPIDLDDVKLPRTNTVTYQGKTAAEWGPLLFDTDVSVSREAAVALGNIKAEALRFYAQGLKNSQEHVRFFSVNTLPCEAANYPEAFVPLLRETLLDSSARVRQFTAMSIMNCHYSELLSELRDARDHEKDEAVKADMARYTVELEKAAK